MNLYKIELLFRCSLVFTFENKDHDIEMFICMYLSIGKTFVNFTLKDNISVGFPSLQFV